MLSGEGNKNGKKTKTTIGLTTAKKQLCTCSTFFCTFLCRWFARHSTRHSIQFNSIQFFIHTI